jgi:succinate-semialdehyde dehydrogenase/glutarate-semialdehyde dehydrogenase
MDEAVPRGCVPEQFASYGQIEQIIADRRIVGVSLTGSERAGSVVAAIAGKNLKKCVPASAGPTRTWCSTPMTSGIGRSGVDTRIGNTGQVRNSNKRMPAATIDCSPVGWSSAADPAGRDPQEAADGYVAAVVTQGRQEIPDEQVWTPSPRVRRRTRAVCSATVRGLLPRPRC